jgi:hypothetical protein
VNTSYETRGKIKRSKLNKDSQRGRRTGAGANGGESGRVWIEQEFERNGGDKKVFDGNREVNGYASQRGELK